MVDIHTLHMVRRRLGSSFYFFFFYIISCCFCCSFLFHFLFTSFPFLFLLLFYFSVGFVVGYSSYTSQSFHSVFRLYNFLHTQQQSFFFFFLYFSSVGLIRENIQHTHYIYNNCVYVIYRRTHKQIYITMCVCVLHTNVHNKPTTKAAIYQRRAMWWVEYNVKGGGWVVEFFLFMRIVQGLGGGGLRDGGRFRVY